MPILRRRKSQGEELKGGFDHNNINSFYIRREAFKNDSPFIKVAEHLASDIAGLRNEAHAKKKDDIPGFFRYFRTFFQHPFFRINSDTFCVIDLRFVLEGVCAGLLWQVHRIAEQDIRELKDEYGQLLERYFSFIAKKAFPDIKLTHKDEGQPDAVLELEDAIILFEFTTEYYRFSSLYNSSFELFEEDLHRLLLNQGKEDKLGRGKKDVGKLVKLDRYVEDLKTEKRVIPVLITENYLGDYDALDQFDGLITAGVNKLGLGQLLKHKPLLLTLDDLETCWAVLKQDQSGHAFVDAARAWNETDKGPFHYNFTYYLTHLYDQKIANDDYKQFFDIHGMFRAAPA